MSDGADTRTTGMGAAAGNTSDTVCDVAVRCDVAQRRSAVESVVMGDPINTVASCPNVITSVRSPVY